MKYKLTDETIKHNGITLYRIQALKDFGDVKAGDLGGWVQSEKNLSQDGDCWIDHEAKVFDTAGINGDALVYGNAQVFGDARVFNYVRVFENARVFGNAWVFGNVDVFGDTWVYGNAQVFGDAEINGGFIG